MTKYLFKILMIFPISIMPLYSQCDTSDAVFAIYPEDIEYLRYIEIWNSFDTISVRYTVGEFRVVKGQQVTKLPLLSTLSNGERWIQGQSEQGEDQILLQHSKTANFKYQTGSSIKFFRAMRVHRPCWISKSDLPSEDVLLSYARADQHWIVGKNRIHDDSEWVIQLVRASDNQVLAIIDSVGILRNSDTIMALRYGTGHTEMNHLRHLPDEWANTVVYLRISTRRFGSTPYGMVMNFENEMMNMSLFMDYCDRYPLSCKCKEQSDYDYLLDRYLEELIRYCDSVKLATGFLPEKTTSLIALDTTRFKVFWYRYMEPYKIIDGDTIWVEKDNFQGSIATSNPDFERQFNKIEDRVIKINRVFPNPTNEPEINIDIISNDYVGPAFIAVYEYFGRLLLNHKILINKGQNIIKLNIGPNRLSGIYYVLIKPEYEGNKIFDKTKFIYKK